MRGSNLLAAKGGCLTFGANALGASLAGVVPYAGVGGKDINNTVLELVLEEQATGAVKHGLIFTYKVGMIED